jgi:hypothetical protein
MRVRTLIEYAEQNGLAYLWEGMHAFAKRQQQLSPEQIRDRGGARLSWRESGDAVL